MTDFHFQSTVLLRHTREQVFEFFSRAENLDLLTPTWLHFNILTPMPVEMGLATRICYRIRIRGMPVRWVSEITEWSPPHVFEDTQVRGPYRKWVHRHVFEETPEGTLVHDYVSYRVPGGALVNRILVSGQLRRIFDYRRAKMLEVFPGVS